MRITLAGEELELLAEKAVYWPREATLLAADLHWGKSASFAAAGIRVPPGTIRTDLQRLSDLLHSTQARRLVVLGDLVHARTGLSRELRETVVAWRDQHRELIVELVRGNHDAASGELPADWRITSVPAPRREPPFAWLHHPGLVSQHYSLGGHVHPAVTLRGRGRQRLKLPCFLFGAEFGILPAFGDFTGHAAVTPTVGDRVFVIADGQVLEVSPHRPSSLTHPKKVNYQEEEPCEP